MKLLIDEEYGYRLWEADLTDAEFEQLKTRWRTMKGLHCMVPVRLIIPQARPADPEKQEPGWGYRVNCHVHEHDDSILTGCTDYQIPEGEPDPNDPHFPLFEMEGWRYSVEDLERISGELKEEVSP